MIDIDVLRKVQKKLSRYIYAKGFLSWNGIRKACNKIILALPEEEQRNFNEKSYPEFDIFIPLLRNASAEVCKSIDRATLLFCMNPNVNLIAMDGDEYVRGQEYFSLYKTRDELEKNKTEYRKGIPFKPAFNPMSFLKSFPSIEQHINDFAEQQIKINAFQFEQNLMNYQYENMSSTKIDVGIYKLNDFAWSSPYLYEKNGKVRKIPYYAEDPDAMNLARLYVRISNPAFTKPFFEYNMSSQDLTCIRYSEMPILLTRALLLFEPTQLTSKEFCTNHPSIPFRKIPEDAIKELKRIFSDKTVIIR